MTPAEAATAFGATTKSNDDNNINNTGSDITMGESISTKSTTTTTTETPVQNN